MAVEHERLIQEYQRYKDELASYEKELYAYTKRIEEYGNIITQQIQELRRLGVEIPELNSVVDGSGEIDLSDSVVVRKMVDIVYKIYKEKIEECDKILSARNSK